MDDDVIVTRVYRIQVDGIRRRAGGVHIAPMIAVYGDLPPGIVSHRWRPAELTDADLDRYVRTGLLPWDQGE